MPAVVTIVYELPIVLAVPNGLPDNVNWVSESTLTTYAPNPAYILFAEVFDINCPGTTVPVVINVALASVSVFSPAAVLVDENITLG